MAAEIILSPVAKKIFTQVTDLAWEQVGLLWNFKRELHKLKSTVSAIQALLRDAEKKQHHNHQAKDWLQKLSNIIYDVDDLLDDLSTEARRKAMIAAEAAGDDGRRRTTATTTCCSLVGFLFSPLQQLWYDLMMARAVKAIRERLDDVKKDKDSLGLHPPTEDEARPPRETDSCPPTIVVGREEDKRNTIQRLMDPHHKSNISFVPIFGMGGVGKTTLAQLVFDDQQVKDHFYFRVWVYVSQSFDIKVILGKMLQSLTSEIQVDLPLENLQTRLREKISGERFLFVLDDVWEENVQSWETLGKYLTIGAPGSKVLVTTRSKIVAKATGGRALQQETSGEAMQDGHLRGLSVEKSWDLLVEIAGGVIGQTQDEINIGKAILEKCHGVPLAISTIATVLIDSQDPGTEWPLLLQKELYSISNTGDYSIMPALQLSFNQLPSHMKDCFLYCKLFTRGCRLDVQMLVQFWVAQGYFESEDASLQCVKTLWWRSFFHGMKMDELGKMSTCTVHDMMYDVAVLMAGPKILRSSSPTILTSVASETHHLAVARQDDDGSTLREAAASVGNDYGLSDGNKVRTLLSDGYFSREECAQVLDGFKRARVLRLPIRDSDTAAYNMLDRIGELKHLRHLSIRFNLAMNLPNSVTDLLNLQVLDLAEFNIRELPEGLRKLVNLKHLFLNPFRSRYLTHMPQGIGGLQSLQTLPVFVVGWRRSMYGSEEARVGVGLEELEGLNALRGELTVIYLADARFLGDAVCVLKNKPLLRSLVLDWGGPLGRTRGSTEDGKILEITLSPPPYLKKLVIRGGYGGARLPNWLAQLVHLVEISLENCDECEYLPPLYLLPSLKKLGIKSCRLLKGTSVGDGDHCNSPSPSSGDVTEEKDREWSCFPCLAYLYIGHCPNLSQMPAFPTLESQLELEYTSLAPLERTMKMVKSPASSSASIDLRPLSKLTKLTLRETEGVESLPEDGWSSLDSLQQLRLVSLIGCAKLPNALGSITSLTDIELCMCESVEYLPPLHELPSLTRLAIKWCPKLKGWWKKGSSSDHDRYYFGSSTTSAAVATEEGDGRPLFAHLSRLQITGCPNLTRVPLFPTVESELHLEKTSSRALLRTMEMKVKAAAANDDPEQRATSQLLHPLSKLTYMVLREIDDLESLPEEGFRNLTSLRVLEIVDCRSLATLPQAIRHLTSMKRLEIRGCPMLAARLKKGSGEDWPNISHIPELQVY